MDSTIILTMARSGSTFLARKLLGMAGLERQKYWHRNEIAFEDFFIKNHIQLAGIQEASESEDTEALGPSVL